MKLQTNRPKMIPSWRIQLLVVMSGALFIAAPAYADTGHLNGPIIFPQSSEVTLEEGQNFTITCRGKKPLNFAQQELSEDKHESSSSMEVNVTLNEETYYELTINLYNVDKFTVGFYACFDDTLSLAEVFDYNIIEEPANTEHVSYIYVYVNGSSLFAPFHSLVQAKSNSKFLIECKPTSPDINVTLDLGGYLQYYNPKLGFVLNSEVLNGSVAVFALCHFEGHGYAVDKDVFIHQNIETEPPTPTISGGNRYFLKGETFTINCTVNPQSNMPIILNWSIPGPMSKVNVVSNEHEYLFRESHLFSNYTITDAGPEDAGQYVCQTRNNFKTNNDTFIKEFLEKPFVIIKSKSHKESILEVTQKSLRFHVDIEAYPPPKIEISMNNGNLNPKVKPTLTEREPWSYRYVVSIYKVDFKDSGNYTITISNGVNKTENFDVRIKGAPSIEKDQKDLKYPQGVQVEVDCQVLGYPLPQVKWIFSQGSPHQLSSTSQIDVSDSVYHMKSTLTVLVRESGNLTCLAWNELGNDSYTRRLLVYEIPNGFGIKNKDTWFSENDNVVLTCVASIYDFENVTWIGPDGKEPWNVEFLVSTYSYIAKVKFDGILVSDAGKYACTGIRNDAFDDNDTTVTETIYITVAENRPPKISEAENQNVEVLIYHPINLTCIADAVPPPSISWYKDGLTLETNENINIKTVKLNQTLVNSTVLIDRMDEESIGIYYCKVTSEEKYVEKSFNLGIKEKPSPKKIYLSVIGAIFIILIILVIYLAWKIRKEKKFRKELRAAGLLNFKKGAAKSINPDLGIDEQAELLPYDEKFEFPAEKLVLGKQLGAGAFGVVYKADARGIINAEETSTVAVKMVKKTADNMYIKALASELKIMVHLGKHINIVNLLGACTKNVGKRELIVIVEYCKYGNLHNYLQKHREVFIDQLTDNSEKSFGKINRGFSCSSGTSGTHSEYFGSNHTQETDHTFLNTANTGRSGRKDNQKQVEFVKVSETGYVQPEWRTNYESDYSFDGRSPRPLCSRDLLTWAFQIARGMEYLASRKVLHGDLAARNVLLADDNVVKICDFGLARSIYKNDEYQKKENSPLPVKWLAIECMTDRIFSTQSDVWSFGIVLWELFTLAKTPYPNVSPPSLLQFLSDGHRLEKPMYADDKLYDVMKKCWEQKPNARPTFSQLQQILGSFLEESVRNHYVDLNATYMDMNVKRDGEDYLAMVNAPDYNNLVTPSPHHYVNDTRSFFPPTPTLQHDDEGYLQMSPATKQTIFNARPPSTKFDFDARKLAPRASEPNSYGSELTPMLTLNNLPRSGSESDHEGGNSPYLNMCPRIEEETDEVFETKQNNLKNTQPSAVTNPTYITITTDDEKKSQNITNNYINVPNGLVK